MEQPWLIGLDGFSFHWYPRESIMASGRASGHNCDCALKKSQFTCRHVRAFVRWSAWVLSLIWNQVCNEAYKCPGIFSFLCSCRYFITRESHIIYMKCNKKWTSWWTIPWLSPKIQVMWATLLQLNWVTRLLLSMICRLIVVSFAVVYYSNLSVRVCCFSVEQIL